MKTNEQKTKPPVNEPPQRSILEEVGNAVNHGVGALIGIAGMVLLLLRSDTETKVFSSLIYGISFIMMFLMSCLYHAFKGGTRVKRLWRRFDYLSIYLLIGGIFTPLWLIYWGGKAGTIGCIAEWTVIIAGITLISVFGPDRLRKMHLALYVILGWCGLIFLPKMTHGNLLLFFFTLTGGLSYTLGIIPFALKKKGAHFIWHFFVLFGAVIHWFGIYMYVYG